MVQEHGCDRCGACEFTLPSTAVASTIQESLVVLSGASLATNPDVFLAILHQMEHLFPDRDVHANAYDPWVYLRRAWPCMHTISAM
jgi:hypothetical protein